MFNWLIIIAMIVILLALKVTKFVAIALMLALLVILIAKNFPKIIGKQKNSDRGSR